MMIQTALQVPASRSDTSWARRCRTKTSRASIAITKARNTPHAPSGTGTAGPQAASGPWRSARLLRCRQQAGVAEHGAGPVDGAPAGDQVVLGRRQAAN